MVLTALRTPGEKLFAADPPFVLDSTDAIVGRFQSLSQQMAERSDLLQKSIAQSQSVQESLENLLQAVAEVEKSLEGEQPAALSSTSIQDSLATSTVRPVPALPRLEHACAGPEPGRSSATVF